MHRKNLLRLFPLALVFVLVGCASSDDGTTPDPDAITPQELAAGEAWNPTDDGDGDGDVDATDDLSIATPAEESSGFIDADDAILPSDPVTPGEIDPDNLDQTSKCQRATGYRRGKAFKICVTKIDGKYVEVNTARAYLRMRKAARRSGVSLRISSGFRTMAQQRYFYRCYKTRSCNGGNLAAPPGYSNHQSGHALDLNTSAGGVYSWLAKHGSAYKFRRTVPSEKWHWEH